MVEDNPADVLLVREALRANRLVCELHAYPDGEQAVEALLNADPSEGLPNLVLLDWNLPTIGGADVLEAIRRRPHLKNVPVAVLTSSTSSTDRETAARLGANRFIHKPNTLDEFIFGVGTCVRDLIGTDLLQ
jgi:CheY-like chemotaxis protein